MQRDLRKHHGGEWEVTAGDSALQGERWKLSESIICKC